MFVSIASVVESHLVIASAGLPASFGPVSRKNTRLQEALSSVLAESVSLVEAGSSDSLDEILESRF